MKDYELSDFIKHLHSLYNNGLYDMRDGEEMADGITEKAIINTKVRLNIIKETVQELLDEVCNLPKHSLDSGERGSFV